MKKNLLMAVIMFLALGCTSGADDTPGAAKNDTTSATVAKAEWPKSTKERPIVVLETDSGTMVMEFYPDIAPMTCDSILALVNRKFYDGLMFHRIVPNFVLQGGDPKGNGTGDAGFKIKAEFSDRKHVEGSLSMARRGDDINSSGCQFFICLKATPNLDGQYNLFGQVIEGMDVAHKLEHVPTGPQNRPEQPVYFRRMYENK